MIIRQETTIEEMRANFNLVTMLVIEGNFLVEHTRDGTMTSGKETIRLQGVDGSWIKEAQFDSGTKRGVLNTEYYRPTPYDVWPVFFGGDYPENLIVGDRICCLCSKEFDNPWMVSYWVPEWVYIQHLTRMKAKYTQY